MNKIISFLVFWSISLLTTAQGEVEMADNFRGEGKIYVVVAVILVILAGIFITLIRLDQRLKKLEKESKEEE